MNRNNPLGGRRLQLATFPPPDVDTQDTVDLSDRAKTPKPNCDPCASFLRAAALRLLPNTSIMPDNRRRPKWHPSAWRCVSDRRKGCPKVECRGSQRCKARLVRTTEMFAGSGSGCRSQSPSTNISARRGPNPSRCAHAGRSLTLHSPRPRGQHVARSVGLLPDG